MNKKDQELKEILKLEKKKYRNISKKYLVFGKHIVLEAIKYGNIDTILVSTLEDQGYYQKIAPNCKIYILNKKEIARFKSLKTIPQVFGVCNMLEQKDFESGNILALNKISNPANLGALLRSARAFGFKNIILDYGTVDLYNPKTIQAMQGVEFSLNIKTLDLFEYIKQEVKNKTNIITTYLNEQTTYYEYQENVIKNMHNNKKNSILIVGNEALGVEDKFKTYPHFNIKIDIAYESLNVVVAASIIMYEIAKG